MKTLLNHHFGALLLAPDDGGTGGGDATPAAGVATAADAPSTTALGGEVPPTSAAEGGTTPENKGAGAEASTALGGGAAEDNKDTTKDGDNKEPEAAAVEFYANADEIDLTPPEGFELDPAIGDEFKALAVELKLPKESVGKLKDMQVRLYAKQQETHAAAVKQWGEANKADAEIGGAVYEENIGKAVAFRDAFFPPEARKVLERTGLGNHPDIVKGFVRAGIAMGEAGIVTGQSPIAAKKSLTDRLYGGKPT
jgi:hypothetical protein